MVPQTCRMKRRVTTPKSTRLAEMAPEALIMTARILGMMARKTVSASWGRMA